MSYFKDSAWKETQEFLPIENRLNSKNLPYEYFINIDDLEIHIDHYKPLNPRGKIVLFHGVGGNGRLLSFIAVRLVKYNYEVICPDLPLYGYTKYKKTIDYSVWVGCGKKIVEYYQDKNPMFLFGLSAGGMLSYQIACELKKIAGVITTCILDQRNKEVNKQTAITPIIGVVGKRMLGLTYKFVGRFKIPMRFVSNMKDIANNDKLVSKLIKDKKSSGASVPLIFLYSMLNPKIKVEPEEFTKCPFLLVHPEKDKWTDIKLSEYFFDRLSCKKELVILNGAGHFPIEKEGLDILEKEVIKFMSKNS